MAAGKKPIMPALRSAGCWLLVAGCWLLVRSEQASHREQQTLAKNLLKESPR